MNNAEKKNSDAKIAANNRYIKKNYVSCALRIKPQQKADIQNTAKKCGLSFASFVLRCCYAYIKNGDVPPPIADDKKETNENTDI